VVKSAEKSRRSKQRLRQLLRRERELWGAEHLRVAGVDEAGVGPLAGPVVAAAVVFRPGQGVEGVDDSKRLTAARREDLAEQIRNQAQCFCVAHVEPAEIDQINIYQAGLLAMRRAIDGLALRPDYLLVDGRSIPDLDLPQERVVGGDAKCHAILAKTERDALMVDYDSEFPGYGFSSHKGYPTVAHRDAIRRLGLTPIHRRSFTQLPPKRLWD
jgi:ribonuclease HII